MSYSTLTEAVEALKKGDQSAFQSVYDGSCRYVYYTILKSVQDKDLADDILQETYIEIFKSISSLKEAEAFKGWAAIIAQHKISRYFRKKSESVFSSEEEMDTVMDSMEEDDTAMLPEDAADNKETQRLIMEIIESLPENQKEAVISFYYNQLSVSEIATAMDVPENTVKTWLSRGKKKIKEDVITLAEKHGTKLYAAPLMLVLSGIFTKEAEACELPAGAYALINSKLVAEGALSAAAAGSAGAKAAAVTAGSVAKAAGINWGIVAAIGVAVGVVGAGTTVGINLTRGNRNISETETSAEAFAESNLTDSSAAYEEKDITDNKAAEQENPHNDNNIEASSEEDKEKSQKDKEKLDNEELGEATEATVATEPSTEETPTEAAEEDDVYEIPEVIKNLKKKSNGHEEVYYLENDELFYLSSQSPIEDKGDYFEISNTTLSFWDGVSYDEDTDSFLTTDKKITLRVRKDAVIWTEILSPDERISMSAEQFFTDTGSLTCEFWRSYGDTISSTGSSISFDDEGYLVEFDGIEHD